MPAEPENTTPERHSGLIHRRPVTNQIPTSEARNRHTASLMYCLIRLPGSPGPSIPIPHSHAPAVHRRCKIRTRALSDPRQHLRQNERAAKRIHFEPPPHTNLYRRLSDCLAGHRMQAPPAQILPLTFVATRIVAQGITTAFQPQAKTFAATSENVPRNAVGHNSRQQARPHGPNTLGSESRNRNIRSEQETDLCAVSLKGADNLSCYEQAPHLICVADREFISGVHVQPTACVQEGMLLLMSNTDLVRTARLWQNSAKPW
jgi:hypothetical protein